MNKNEKILKLKEKLTNSINELDKNKIHILYFSYYYNLHNIYHYPLFILTRLLSLILNKPPIDHVNHISRFIFDDETGNWEAKVFEATIDRGMEQNDLFDKLKSFQGICYIETLNKKVDKKKAKSFENKYTGVPYSKKLAAMSGIDIKQIEKLIRPKTDGGFCSWLEALFLTDQDLDLSDIEKGDSLEITPADLFSANLGKKSILYKF